MTKYQQSLSEKSGGRVGQDPGKRLSGGGNTGWIEQIVWECCGNLGGIDPKPFTLRELMNMAETSLVENWDHTAFIGALIFNVNRDPKKTKAINPMEFNPYRKKKNKKIQLSKEESKDLLKKIFFSKK